MAQPTPRLDHIQSSPSNALDSMFCGVCGATYGHVRHMNEPTLGERILDVSKFIYAHADCAERDRMKNAYQSAGMAGPPRDYGTVDPRGYRG